MASVFNRVLCRLWTLSLLLVFIKMPLSDGQRAGRTRDLSASFEILEESPAGNYVGNVAVGAGLDRIYNGSVLDSLEFGYIRQSGNNIDYFDLESDTGILRTSMAIDRDERCPGKDVCVISLVLAIRKPVDLFQSIAVSVTLLDMNDNSPTFNPSEFSIKFSESDPIGTSRSLPIALDMDSPRFGVLDYRMLTQVLEFDLRTSTNAGSGLTELKLVLVRPLDRELVDTYMIKVICIDGGTPPRNGTLLIDVTVEDDNDHSPEFEENSYRIEVSEETHVNITFFTVHAVDPDAGPNGRVQYEFTPITSSLYGNQFTVGRRTGDLSLKKVLDYETVKSYHLEVVARDQAPNARFTLAQIELIVIDMNDNVPEITISTLTDKPEAEIRENLPAGKTEFLAYVSVFDADIGENGKVMCGLDHPTFRMEHISQNQYKIITDISLDREAVGNYILKIDCYDMGNPSLPSSKELSVNVLDDNDHAPMFLSSHYKEAIAEGNLPDSYIMRVTANDSDIGENAQLRYSIVEPGVAKYVSVQEISGVVRAKIELDYEQIQKIEFTVVARDGGTPQRSATTFVTIVIYDKNDEEPRFDVASYTFNVMENLSPNTPVGQVTAFDLDSPPYNIFEYSMDSRNHQTQDAFEINILTGQISTLKQFDREDEDVYFFTVFAGDIDNPRHAGSATVTIYIDDENDNYPEIISPKHTNKTYQLSNRTPVGYNFTKVSALDADIGENGRLKFSIVSGDPHYLFAIDESSGLVSVNKELVDIEYRELWVKIKVSDCGTPSSKSDSVEILVTVDQNLLFMPLDGDIVHQSNLLVIIIVAAVSGFIIVILIIAIALLKTLDRRRFQGKEYNCRTEEQKILNDLNVKAVEANGKLSHAPRGDGRIPDGGSPAHHLTPDCGKNSTNSLHRKKEKSPQILRTAMEMEEMGTPHVVRNNKGEELPPPPPPHIDPALRQAQDRHLEQAHLMALLKQDQDGDSASSADMSNADSGRGASEEGEASRYVSLRAADHHHHHGLPASVPAPPNAPSHLHGFPQPRYGQAPVRITVVKPDVRSPAHGHHHYAHGHTHGGGPTTQHSSPLRPANTSTFQPRKASSEVDVHKPTSAYKALGTMETRASLQSLPSYSHSRSPAAQKHVTFTGNGGSTPPSNYHTTGGHGRHHKGQPYMRSTSIDSGMKGHSVDSSGYGTIRSATSSPAAQGSPKEEVWQHRRRQRDPQLRDISEEEDGSRASDSSEKVDSAKLCQQIDDIFFKQKSVVV